MGSVTVSRDCDTQTGTGYPAQCGHLQALLAEIVVAVEHGDTIRIARTVEHVNDCGVMVEALAEERQYGGQQ